MIIYALTEYCICYIFKNVSFSCCSTTFSQRVIFCMNESCAGDLIFRISFRSFVRKFVWAIFDPLVYMSCSWISGRMCFQNANLEFNMCINPNIFLCLRVCFLGVFYPMFFFSFLFLYFFLFYIFDFFFIFFYALQFFLFFLKKLIFIP